MLREREPAMSLALEANNSNQLMTNVYNLLREACGLYLPSSEIHPAPDLDNPAAWHPLLL